MTFLPLLLLALLVVVLAYAAWISLQSLLQARALFRLAAHPSGAPDERGRHAVYGRVRVIRAPRRGGVDVLWVRVQHQVYRRRGKNSSWSTESTEEETADFSIDAHAGPVRLSDLPTEVQGTRSFTEVYERTGWLWGHGNGDRRAVITYLAVTSSATAVGRLDGLSLGRDNKLGLLLSPHEPEKAAWTEVFKGVAGLVLVTAVLAAGLLFMRERHWP